MALTKKQAPWDGSKIPLQHGKVVIVTGANSGIGFETAKKLAERHATVVLACRNEERGKKAQRAILEHIEQQRSLLDAAERETLIPPEVEFMLLDVGSLASVSAFADAFRTRFGRLDVLINNAGVNTPSESRTVDGFEGHLGINHLGHFYLTKLLMDLLKQSPAARVVSIGSIFHYLVTMNFNAQGHLVVEGGYNMSKLANLMFTYELERRLRASHVKNVISVAAHPGFADTGIVTTFIANHIPRVFQWISLKLATLLPLQNAAKGALPTLYAATAEDVQGMEYFGPSHLRWWGYPVRELSTAASHDEDKCKKLWMRSEELIKCKFEL